MFDDYIKPDFSIRGIPTSLWLGTTDDLKFKNENNDEVYDTVIVGGGIVGLTTAYYLTMAGQKVAVLELGQIIRDVTGHTTAKITSLHGQIYKYLLETFDEKTAALYGSGQEAAKEEIAKIVEENGIECDFERANSYTFAKSEEKQKELKEEAEAAKQIGLPAKWVDNIELPIENRGAVCFENQALFHPVKYLLAIADIITKNGAKVFENTKATNIREGEICEVLTENGIFKGKNIVIATHFPFYDKGGYFAKMEPHRSFVYAVRLRDQDFLGMYYNEEETDYTFRPAKLDGKKYFIIGGEGHKVAQGDEKESYKRLEEYISSNFIVSSFDYHWSTQDNFTFDRLPYIGKSPGSENVYLATGFGGWGMTNGTLSAIIISDYILGKENVWAEVFDPKRDKPVGSLKKLFGQNLNVAKKFFGGRARGSHDFDLFEELKHDEGRVIEYGGEKVAVYKDKDGNVKKFSPKCTHMGCIVKWNTGEKTWDCPCHGSRYSAEGKVIHGPALRDLENREDKTE